MGWDFGATFRYQFRLSRHRWQPHETWQANRIGDWHLAHCPDLPCHDVILSDGTKAGLVLGTAVDALGQMLNGAARISEGASLQHVQAYIEGLAGRFIAILHLNAENRVYFDPTAGLSAVYSRQDRALASSVHMLLDRDIIPEPAVGADAVLKRESQFLLGETCDAECRRVMANHFLDLNTFELGRHWPKPDERFDQGGRDRAAVARQIADRLSQILGALASGASVALPLSAGTDSRILLAAATPHLSRIDSFYTHDIYRVTRFDRQGAQLLADLTGVSLQVIDRAAPEFTDFMNDEDLEDLRSRMAVRTGLAFNGIDAATTRAVSLTPGTDLVLRGNVAEMTRANKWTLQSARHGASVEDGLAALLNVRAEHLSDRLEPARLKSLRARYAAWAESLPEGVRTRLPDLAHAEVFMPTAPNNVYYAFTRNFYLNPFNDRHLINLTAWFHPLARKKGRLVMKIIGHANPALNGVPYLRDLKRAARGAMAAG